MMKYGILLLANLLSMAVFAQDSLSLSQKKTQTNEVFKAQFGYLPGNIYYTFDNRYEGTKGTPFLFDEWTSGVLAIADSTLIRDSVQFKVDLYNNEILARAFGKQKILFNEQLKSLQLNRKNGAKWVFKRFKSDKLEANRFYQIVFEGKHFTLINDLRKDLRRADFKDNGITQTGTPYDRFEERSVYWIRQDNKPFAKIVLKKGNLVELLGADQRKPVEAYCKQHSLSGKLSEEEAYLLLKFMDESL